VFLEALLACGSMHFSTVGGHKINHSAAMDMDLDSSSIPSLELWASAKFIARECALPNLNFLTCKDENKGNPIPCVQLAELVTQCNTRV